MPEQKETTTLNLPLLVDRVLSGFVEAARTAFSTDLQSVVLYGSGAEGQLRATSDVNLILVLSAFDQVKAEQLREPLRLARAAINLHTMFLLASEVSVAANSFAVKFADVLRRHHVLYGSDPFAGLTLSREAEIARLRQVLLNLALRLRETYVLRSLREEQAALVIADNAGPLRACAATILELEGTPATSPKEALEHIIASFAEPDWKEMLTHISQARENGLLPPGIAGSTLFRLIELVQRLRTRAEQLS